jgi:ornithine cyclodeaminase
MNVIGAVGEYRWRFRRFQSQLRSRSYREAIDEIHHIVKWKTILWLHLLDFGLRSLAEDHMLIINNTQVRELLPMRDCMEVVGEALAALARGDGVQPLRSSMWTPETQCELCWMPGSLAAGQPFGIKIISCVDTPGELGVESHQGGVMIFDPANGAPLALCESGAITAVRTAAASALATDWLARPDATTVAILGAGAEARSHVEAMLEVRPVDLFRVWTRNADKAKAFAEEQAARHGVKIETAADVASAVAGADIVCTTTSAREPILFGEMLSEGTHVNAVGASLASWIEIDTTVVRRSKLFTDRRESLEHEAGEYRLAHKRGLIGENHLQAELGEVINGDHPGRTTDSEITLYRSLGLAVQDIASAQLVYQRALERGVGTEADLSG